MEKQLKDYKIGFIAGRIYQMKEDKYTFDEILSEFPIDEKDLKEVFAWLDNKENWITL